MAYGASLTLKTEFHPERSDLIYGLILTVLFLALLFFAGLAKTTVRFGEGSIIKCQWLFLFWRINLDKYNAVTYKLVSNRTRGGGTYYSLQLMFYVDAEHFKCLSEGLEQHIAEDCIRRNFDRTKLIKLYRYIEQNYPDKARGYE
ncbi:MAG: hypothetical protein J5753_03145, partial [Oscillospiraceae bacterium]|nr:hypothetical protein [Oscillospiraceae bacterium]